jgi:hypothetical protein
VDGWKGGRVDRYGDRREKKEPRFRGSFRCSIVFARSPVNLSTWLLLYLDAHDSRLAGAALIGLADSELHDVAGLE